MDSSPIRVVLPGGDTFVPAFVDAATTYSARRGHSKSDARTFVKLVQLGCSCVNSANPTSVELRVTETKNHTTVVIAGDQPAGTLSPDAASKFSRAADAGSATSAVHESAASVEFAIKLD